MNKENFSSGEVARICGVTLRTVLNWIAKGWLKAYKLPGRRGDNRIKKGDLIEFMKAHDFPLPDDFQPPRRIALVVDDDEMMANSIGRILRSVGMEVHYAHDGFRAGIQYAKLLPTLMTLDLQMPGMSGFEVLKQLSGERQTKIVVISGMDKSALNTAVNLGADAALKKPFENEELANLVRSLC